MAKWHEIDTSDLLKCHFPHAVNIFCNLLQVFPSRLGPHGVAKQHTIKIIKCMALYATHGFSNLVEAHLCNIIICVTVSTYLMAEKNICIINLYNVSPFLKTS